MKIGDIYTYIVAGIIDLLKLSSGYIGGAFYDPDQSYLFAKLAVQLGEVIGLENPYDVPDLYKPLTDNDLHKLKEILDCIQSEFWWKIRILQKLGYPQKITRSVLKQEEEFRRLWWENT